MFAKVLFLLTSDVKFVLKSFYGIGQPPSGVYMMKKV